jgi:hypothetical protein
MSNLQALKMLSSGELCTSNPKETKRILVSASNMLFGISTEAINTDLIKVCFKAICDRFKDITIEDIKNSYSFAEIEKKAYTTLTRGELLQPIKEYLHKKNILISEMLEIEANERKEFEKKQEASIFLQNSIEKFNESLKTKVFEGSEIEAYVVLQNQKEKNEQIVADSFSQEFKKELWNYVCKKRKEAEMKTNDFGNVLENLKDPKWLFAKELIDLYLFKIQQNGK